MLCFKVYFTKDLKKKHKSYDEGVAKQENGKTFLFSSEGEKISESRNTKWVWDSKGEREVIYMGKFLIEKESEFPSELFIKGTCFRSDSLLVETKPNAKALVPKTNLLGKKNKMGEITGKGVLSNAMKKVSEERREVPVGGLLLNDDYEAIGLQPCFLDGFIGKNLRPHQKEGVKFMFDCVSGLRSADIEGCILADSMGLGKTLQTISLVWVLLKQSPLSPVKGLVNKAVIVTPVSMVRSWQREITKWLGAVHLQPLCAIGDREKVQKVIRDFVNEGFRCLLISYESFRTNARALGESKCDLLILDEGHRIKNMGMQTYQAFNGFPCRRRVILTGTPLQNSMEELYSCVSFVNPKIFPSLTSFKKVYAEPIMAGAEIARKSLRNNNQETVAQIARERSKELTAILSTFMLRRTSKILEKLLPPRNEVFIFHKMAPMQEEIYQKFLQTNSKALNQTRDTSDAFTLIISLRKITMHPLLLTTGDAAESKNMELMALIPTAMGSKPVEELSPKFLFLKNLFMKVLAANSDSKRKEKVIVVSYFSTTLDLVHRLCDKLGIGALRLDGSVPADKRQGLIDRFNDRFGSVYVFLLAAKAGGTGLNLTVANRMVLMDPDWNPSNDLQVMARVWRDGQVLPVFIYRLVAIGTIEEKILQRQFLKEKISDQVIDEKMTEMKFDKEELKKLFQFNSNASCDVFSEKENQLGVACVEVSPDLDEEQLQNVVFVKNRRAEEAENEREPKEINELLDSEEFLQEVGRKNQENAEETKSNENEEENEESMSETKENSVNESNSMKGGMEDSMKGLLESNSIKENMESKSMMGKMESKSMMGWNGENEKPAGSNSNQVEENEQKKRIKTMNDKDVLRKIMFRFNPV